MPKDTFKAFWLCLQEARGETTTPTSPPGADPHMLHAYGSLEEDEDFPSMY